MTPEERMDKLEGDLARMSEAHDTSFAAIRRLSIQFMRMSQAEHRAFMAKLEAERETRKAEHEVFMAQHDAVMAEYRQERERRKQLEGRVNGVEDMKKLLREILEKDLRPPDGPPESKN